MKHALNVVNLDVTYPSIQLGKVPLNMWERKYQLRDSSNNPVDLAPIDTFKRVARAISSVEKEDRREYWYEKMLWALLNGALPAGRILSNAGAEVHKPSTTTINCTVSRKLSDSMQDILEGVVEAGMTLKRGAGIGYEFSTLRPKGAFVSGAGAFTSGPLSFMDIYDRMCATVSSAGGRRGAQMATFDIRHPDVEELIVAKREDGRLRHFNISLLITHSFMEAVSEDHDWNLIFPAMPYEIECGEYEIVYDTWPSVESFHTVTSEGLVACRVYKKVRARNLFDRIMRSNYDFGEPGFLLIDQINEMNNNWFCEDIRATNPCGELPLPYYGSCLLGSIVLSNFIVNPFTTNEKMPTRFDWDRFREVVGVFSRMLDNVVEINRLPLPGQRAEMLRKRRHGMGFTGLGSALAMMGIRYGSNEAVSFTEKVSEEMALISYLAGMELAEEKGPAPIMEEDFIITESMMKIRPEMRSDGIKVGDQIKGKVLWAKYSRYMQQFPQEFRDRLSERGCRYTHATSIAPTGTISLTFGNNCSGGIEPTFAHDINRNIIVDGKAAKEMVRCHSLEYAMYKRLVDQDAGVKDLPESFVVADDITPDEHVRMQSAAQKWVDSSISKTINVPTDIDYDDFKEIYHKAVASGLKGCTTFRFNPEAFQGVLVRDEDLEKTIYRFTLADGSVIEAKGNQDVLYKGDTFTAANLYDAIKENKFGKY